MSIDQLEETKECSPVDLIPVQQSLSLIERIVKETCLKEQTGEVVCGEGERQTKVVLMFVLKGMGHCSKNLLKTAICFSKLIISLKSEGGEQACR